MKDGHRLVNCDMYIMELVHLLPQSFAPACQFMVTGVALGWQPQSFYPFPWLIDGMPLNQDGFLLPYNRIRTSFTAACNNRNVQFAAERGYDPEAQLMGRELEGIDIAVLFPTLSRYFIARESIDPQLSHAICRAYNDWLYNFCQYSPDPCTDEDFATADTAAAQRERKASLVGD